MSSKRNAYNYLALSFFILGAVLRILLCLRNPPENAFDDHFEPIFMIMKTGHIPAKDACWQCYHPPVFYWISAMVGNLAKTAGLPFQEIVKILQFIPCCYGILTLPILFLILRKVPLSSFSRTIAFGTACFLPRHIYMSAINSNDTISYLLVAISLYLFLLAIERRLPHALVIVTSVIVTVTLFTKYTTYVLIPVLVVAYAAILLARKPVPRRHALLSLGLALAIPIVALSTYFSSNMKHYHRPLPWNVSELDPAVSQPRDPQKMNFITFKPWESVTEPILSPGHMHSFWTLIYNGMWFDNQPLFLYYPNPNPQWWGRYYGWLRGETRYPGPNPSMSTRTRLVGSGLELLGLLPLLLMANGMYVLIKQSWSHWRTSQGLELAKLSLFPALFFGNAAGIVALALRLPVYSAAKASYFLNSMPAFAVFLGFGIVPWEKNKKLAAIATVAFVILFIFCSIHILNIYQSLQHVDIRS